MSRWTLPAGAATIADFQPIVLNQVQVTVVCGGKQREKLRLNWLGYRAGACGGKDELAGPNVQVEIGVLNLAACAEMNC